MILLTNLIKNEIRNNCQIIKKVENKTCNEIKRDDINWKVCLKNQRRRHLKQRVEFNKSQR